MPVWLMLLVAALFRLVTLGQSLDGTPPGDDDDDDPPPGGRADAVQLAALNERLRAKKRAADNEARGLRGRLQEAERKLQGFEGATVLAGADAAAYEAYKALGKPDEVKATLGQVEALSTELTGLKKAATIREVAEVAGMKPAVLSRLGGDLEYVVKDATGEDGKPIRVAHVKGEKGETPLADYAAREWADFLPALTASGSGTGQQQTGIRVPVQGTGDGTPTNPLDTFLAQHNDAVDKTADPFRRA